MIAIFWSISMIAKKNASDVCLMIYVCLVEGIPHFLDKIKLNPKWNSMFLSSPQV